jgi:hypothetical protein
MELECPTCDVPLALHGDEQPGEEVFCATCGAPAILKANEEDEEMHAEEDY